MRAVASEVLQAAPWPLPKEPDSVTPEMPMSLFDTVPVYVPAPTPLNGIVDYTMTVTNKAK